MRWWKAPALAVLSGVLLSLAWLGASGLVLMVAFVPLLYLNHWYVLHKHKYLPVVFWANSFIAMLVWNGLSTWWIVNATVPGALFAIITNSFLMSLAWLMIHYAFRTRKEGFASIFAIFMWLSVEFLHFNWDMAWPWLTLGNGLANDVMLIQWYEFTGVMGGSFWILLMNLFIWMILKAYLFTSKPMHFLQILATLGVVMLPIMFSIFVFQRYHETENPINVVLLQPNIDPYHDKFDRIPAWQQHQLLVGQAKQYNGERVDLFIGPETALHDIWQNNIENEQIILQIKSLLTEDHPEAAFIMGAMTYRLYPGQNEASKTARPLNDSETYFDAFNSALFMVDGKQVGLYHKTKLVSGVEKIPFRRYFRVFEKLVVDLGGTTGTLATDNQQIVFEHNDIKAAVPICYESAFGGYNSGFIKNGANLLVVITNDGWWKNTPGYKQHLSFSRIQAIQFRRSVARSANTGISAVIDQQGRIVQQTNWWEETTLKAQVNLNEQVTFYARHGDYFGRVALFMFLLMGLRMVVSRKM
jgi:apolipoprotein N-acyltransferase